MSTSGDDGPALGPRPYHHTENDHRGIVLTVTILFTVYSLMVLAMRVASKYRNMAIEDWLSAAATIIAVPQFVSIVVATVDGGFGSSYTLLSPSDTRTVAKSLRAGDVLFLLALFGGKCSVIWLCRRLFAVGQHEKHLYCEITIAICGVWCLGSIIAATAGCTSSEVIRSGSEKCSGLVTRWIVIGLFDALLEVVIWCLSLVVVFPLRMTLQRKIQASMCFVLRLPIVILIGLQIKYVSDFSSASNPGIALTRPVLLRQAEVVYSLLSAAIPALNQYLRKFDTTQATVFGYNAGQYGSGGHSYQMDSLTAQGTKSSDTRNYTRMENDKATEVLGKSTSMNFCPPDHMRYHASVEGPNNERFNQDGRSNVSHEEGSLGRHNSEEFIIRKDVEYTVRHEQR